MEIKTKEDYRKALERLELIFDAPVGTSESNEADILAAAIDVDENKQYPIS